MTRLFLALVIGSLSLLSVRTAEAQTVGAYSGCKKLGGNAGACTACLRSGQFFNFDNARKQWVCGATKDMKPSKPVSKRPTSKPIKPSSVKKR